MVVGCRINFSHFSYRTKEETRNLSNQTNLFLLEICEYTVILVIILLCKQYLLKEHGWQKDLDTVGKLLPRIRVSMFWTCYNILPFHLCLLYYWRSESSKFSLVVTYLILIKQSYNNKKRCFICKILWCLSFYSNYFGSSTGELGQDQIIVLDNRKKFQNPKAKCK